MSKLAPMLMAACVLILAQDAAAAAPAAPPAAVPPAAPQAAARAKADPAKLRDCERAWTAQRIRTGSHRAFIRACVRHG